MFAAFLLLFAPWRKVAASMAKNSHNLAGNQEAIRHGAYNPD
ncbi:hypothetical protein PJ912_03875 [Pectobacterium colocasium]|nr:hypothetical protein PJ912_03875 [Pectobacterium colocasium]